VKTKQETFDIVWKGLAAQGWKKSMTAGDDEFCAYRGVDDCACAAGHLIPDDRYDPKMEGGLVLYSTEYASTASSIAVTNLMVELGHDLAVVRECQRAHDGSDTPESMQLRLRKVAQQHGLTVPELEPAS
jgi:hypothetical protein